MRQTTLATLLLPAVLAACTVAAVLGPGPDDTAADTGADSADTQDTDTGSDTGDTQDSDTAPVGPRLEIEPSSWTFSGVQIACEATHEVRLRSVGDADLTVTGVDLVAPHPQYGLVDLHDYPIVLAPAASTSLWVTYLPTSVSPSLATLRVESDDPRGDLAAEIHGSAEYASWETDPFVVPDSPPVDILFAVDQSCSMEAHANQLAANFEAILPDLAALGVPWRAGVVTEDDGCLEGGILEPTTPDLAEVFTAAVTAGDQLTLTEQLFEVVGAALAETGGSGCNAGFVQTGHRLHVVFVSDEYEQSGIPPADFVADARSYLSDPGLLAVSGIICSPSGCGHVDGYDTGYATAVSLTGGGRVDIMASDWDLTAEWLAGEAGSSVRFTLSETGVVPQSVTVSVDGVPQATGWSYDAGSNSVVFTDPLDAGSEVEVEYGVTGECP